MGGLVNKCMAVEVSATDLWCSRQHNMDDVASLNSQVRQRVVIFLSVGISLTLPRNMKHIRNINVAMLWKKKKIA